MFNDQIDQVSWDHGRLLYYAQKRRLSCDTELLLKRIEALVV